MTGATLTIAALAFIAGTIGAWLTWVQLRDEQRRFEKRARLGLGDFGATASVISGRGGCNGRQPQDGTRHSGSKRAARKPQ